MIEALGIVNIGVFVLGTVVIIIAPGPNSLYVLSTATRRGVRDGYKAAGGVLLGDSVLMLAASLGVDSVVRLYPVAFSLIQYAGAVFLGYLGIKALIAAFRKKDGAASQESAECRENPFKRALLLSLANPKAILFFVSFFVQFVDPAKGHPGLAFLVLACIVQTVSITYLTILIFGGSKLAAMAKGNQTLQRLGTALTGSIFVGFGCRLALKAAGS
ncbi:leucine efflux protein LeuE [Desulfovibrio sp. OttesenSCG-928-O18]|nr:leucine efflux protein LeuE [Desulfovibrio sp. OttesenSCG-928-O18]